MEKISSTGVFDDETAEAVGKALDEFNEGFLVEHSEYKTED